ncbi:putative extensin-like [Sesbania bispinosa]|nr:putative extensin-like [Sesbania bispinosa]
MNNETVSPHKNHNKGINQSPLMILSKSSSKSASWKSTPAHLQYQLHLHLPLQMVILLECSHLQVDAATAVVALPLPDEVVAVVHVVAYQTMCTMM